MTPAPGPHGLPDARLEQNIADAKPNFTPGEAVAEANRCLYCHDAPCIAACPTGIDIPAFIRKIGTGNLRGSARTILSANLLGYSCARVCPVEVLCAGACVYNAWHRTPIRIGRLQRFAVESQFDAGVATALLSRAPGNGRRVACVGAGPASLACAGYLALEGCRVTVYEKNDLPGGLNAAGVAPYKMHAEGALAEVEFIRSLGVEIRTGMELGRNLDAATLLRDHEAVFLALGLGRDSRLGVPGEDGPEVAGAIEWIERLKLEPGYALPGVEHAAVVGGGNTAIDAARALAKLGVRDVVMLYRRTEADMSGYAHELELARSEGVRLVERAVPSVFVRDGDVLRGIRLADGREFECDFALLAIGQGKLGALLATFPGIVVGDDGRAQVDADTGATGNPKVWIGGDASGGELVVTAVQDGKRAARAIAASLGLPARADSPMNAGR